MIFWIFCRPTFYIHSHVFLKMIWSTNKTNIKWLNGRKTNISELQVVFCCLPVELVKYREQLIIK